MITIVEWTERYEVSEKNAPAKNGDPLRAGPLQYIRLKVHGHQNGVGFRRLKIVAGTRAMEVFGIFCKILEIAGNQRRDMRGCLYNEKGNPASVNDLAFILDIPAEQVDNALSVLSCEEVGWIIDSERKKVPKKESNTIQLNTYSRLPQIPVIPGIVQEPPPAADENALISTTEPPKRKPRTLPLPALDDIIEYINQHPEYSDVEPEAFFNHYEARGWKYGRGIDMKNWKAAVRTWHFNGRKQHVK